MEEQISFDKKSKDEQFKERGKFEGKEKAREEAIRILEKEAKDPTKITEKQIEEALKKIQERQETKPFGE